MTIDEALELVYNPKTRVCHMCGVEKDITSFNKNKNSSGGVGWWCRTCTRSYTSAQERREYKLKSIYGITIDEYDAMIVRQRNSCAICGVYFENKSNIHVDHCHKTGKVRGILCSGCNTRLGHYEYIIDRPDILHSIESYLSQ